MTPPPLPGSLSVVFWRAAPGPLWMVVRWTAGPVRYVCERGPFATEAAAHAALARVRADVALASLARERVPGAGPVAAYVPCTAENECSDPGSQYCRCHRMSAGAGDAG